MHRVTMFHTPTSSPRRTSNCSEAGGGGTSTEMDPARGRSQTPRDHQFQQRQRNHHPSQRTRPLYKNMPTELSSCFPPHIQEHGRWESSEGYQNFSAPRFGGPRRGAVTEKEAIDLQSLPVLKQLHKNIFNDVDGVSAEGSVSDEKYRAQLRTFPELPQLAHERIREFGNEIVACYSIQLCKFLNDALIETTPNSFAVFTKKSRTGQRWLMVFRSERGRVNVSFNKLLTNQLLIRCLNPVSVEVEPARGLSNTPQETCVFTFNNHTEANKFVHDIHESQTIVWNHREMFLEQTLRGGVPNADFFLDAPVNFGYYSPRPLSARASSGYYIPSDLSSQLPLTPRMKILPPAHNRPKRSPFTVSARTTPRADIDDNWRGCCEGMASMHGSPVSELNVALQGSPSSVTQSPIRKRSKGSTKDNLANVPNSLLGGGDVEFVYNSLTHAMALQQNAGSKLGPSATTGEGSPTKEVSTGRRFQVSDVLVSNKRDVGTGDGLILKAPDEEFFSVGAGELQMIDNGQENFDEIKCFTSAGQLMFSQILFGWNKVRHPEGNHKNPKTRWWIGAAVLGAAGLKNTSLGGGDAPRIREFKATFSDEDSAKKFSDLFQEGAIKGNDPEVRKKYLAQSLRI